MLELNFEDKVKVWRDLRNTLEVHPRPLHKLMSFINTLPVSSRSSSPFDPKSQIQPWHLLEKPSFTEYEIAQLCAYTLQLTDRFSQSKVEIHISTNIKNNESMFLVYLDGCIVLGYNNEVVDVNQLPKTVVSQKIYVMPPLN